MSSKHWRGPTIPGAGDDLLQAWDKMVDTAGIIMVASSIASARAMMSTAAAAGTTISTAYPAYFDINGIIYKADGSKGDDGYRMTPINEVGRSEVSYGKGATITKGPLQRTVLVTSTLPAAPYDRQVCAWGMLSGLVSAGGYSAGVGIMGGDWQDARMVNTYATSGSDQSSAAPSNFNKVPAGVDPQIQLSVISGDAATNRLDISNASQTCKLSVLAFPITMA